MNKLIEKYASEVKVGEQTNYAVVLVDGRDYYGMFDISNDKKMKESVAKIASDRSQFPREVVETAMGVINTIYMAKTGSDWPLFVGVQRLDDNILNVRDIDWDAFEASDKYAGRNGYIYNGHFLPLDTIANIEAASELLQRHEHRFDGKDRVKFANAIADAADKLNIETGKIVEKYASKTLNPNFYDMMADRVRIAKDYPETVVAIEKIIEDSPAMSVNKVAEAVAVIDTMIPFSMKFGSDSGVIGSDRPMFFSRINVPDAYSTVFDRVERPLRFHEKVAMIDDEKLKSVFSDLFVEKLREDPEAVVNNAAPQVKTVLEGMIRQAN